MPIDYKKYPANWKSEIVPNVRKRSGNRCETCRLRNHSVGYRNEDGLFIPTYGNAFHDLIGEGIIHPGLIGATYKEAKGASDYLNEIEEEGRKWIVIVLTVAHLDHNINNNEMKNLRHLCQRCHNRYDAYYRRENRKKRLGQIAIL